MKIFKQIEDSIKSKDFYQSIPKNVHLNQTIKYLIKVSLLLSVVGVIFITFHIPKVITSIKKTTSSFIASYPADLVLNLQGGNISINKPEPFTMPFDEKFKANFQQKNDRNEKVEMQEYKDIENMVTIDTTKPFSIEEFKNMKTMFWVTKSEIIAMRDSDGRIQILPMSKFKDTQIDKSWVNQKEAWFYKFLPILVCFSLIVIYFIFFIGTLFSSLFFAFFYGLIIYGMSYLSKKELTYRQSYIMSIYAMTPIMILNKFTLYINIPLQGILNLLILIAVVYFNYFKYHQDTTENKTP